MESLGVEPVVPAEGGEFDVVDGPSWSLPADQLGLVEPVDRLCEGVVVAVTDGANRRCGSELGEAFAVTDRCELDGFNQWKQHWFVGGSVGDRRGLRPVFSSGGFCVAVS